MDRKPQGVVSYAGLDETALLAGARLMFAGDGSGEGGRFASLMPLFPAELILSMPFAGVAQQGAPVAPGGFSIDPAEYHCRLQKQLPRLYTGDNLTRNRDGDGTFHGRGVVTVDEAWTTSFPQYQPYAGERLCIYPLGGGAQCAAVPESLYPKAAGLLRSAETALGITHRCHDYAHYVYQRIRAGEMFDAVAHLPCEIEPTAFVFQHLYHAATLLSMFKAALNDLVERVLARMTKRRMPEMRAHVKRLVEE
mgnify:CR=1 FL=1